VSVSGTGSDGDGFITGYQWTRISGPASFNIVSAGASTTVINGLTQGVYQFELKVTDNLGATGRDTVQVAVLAANLAPVAHAGADITITLPVNTVNLNGSGTDGDGTVAFYQWTKISGPSAYNIVNASAAQTQANNLVQGAYLFQLTVTDNQGAVGKDTVMVTVNPQPNLPPVANAGADQTITLPVNSITVNGSGTDSDGSVVAYNWTRISGPASFNIVNPNQSITSFTDLVEGVYKFELKVTDNVGAIGRDTVTVTVKPDPRVESTATVYPSPASSTINVKIDAITHRNLTDLKIYDEKGVLVYAEEFLRTVQVVVKTIDISKLSKGSYFIVVNVDVNNNTTLKFVKQ
jgi:Secretion system C-terminal sorting domain